MKNSVTGSRRNRKSKAKFVMPSAGPLVALKGLLREARAGSVTSITAFSGHAVPGPGVGTLDHSKSFVGCGGSSGSTLAKPLWFCFVLPSYHLFLFALVLPYPARN